VLFEKTDEGRKAIQTRHVRLTPCQRAVLITVNGSQSADDLVATAAKMGGSHTDVEALIQLGLISVTISPQPEVAEGAIPVAMPASTAESATQTADPEAPKPVSIESLWPEPSFFPKHALNEMELQRMLPQEGAALDPVAVTPFPFDPASMQGPLEFSAAKQFALGLLEPLGLRAIQLRRTVEAAQSFEQLLEIEPLIRDLVPKSKHAQMDSVFWG
jgi:hypothetical protein